MEYDVNLKNEDFYIPRTGKWILDTFKINLEKAVLYQTILNKGYMVWTPEWIGTVFGYSKDKVKDMLKYLVDIGAITKKTVNVGNGSTRCRCVYVALYTIEGKRNEGEIEALLRKGEQKLEIDYAEKRYYHKKHS